MDERQTPEKDAPDFEWCDVRWQTPERRGDHICAKHEPGHTEHVCCCGAVIPPGKEVSDEPKRPAT